MRPIKLLPALTAMASLLALAPAGAIARPGHSPKAGHRSAAPTATGNCHLSLEAPKVITYGEVTNLTGELTCPSSASAKEVPVTIYQRTIGTKVLGVTPGTPVATDAIGTGAYHFEIPALRGNTLFFARVGGVQSAAKVVKVAPQVTLKTPAEGAQLLTATKKASNAVVFSGTVSPELNGASVALQREDSISVEEWHLIARGVVHGGTFSISHALAAGIANIRVVVRQLTAKAPRTTAGASNSISLTISQRQNPKLTINSSADPIIYGGSTTISGVVAGAADKTPVTLLAHTHGGKFAPVATGTTSGNTYSFPQTPKVNTAYKVTTNNGKVASTELVQGVKFAVTAAPTATTVTAGVPVTFTGMVSPGEAHTVYIERKDASGVGFHVIEAGTVGAGGTISVSHAFLNAGEVVLRVKVPGDPAHQGHATEPVTIKITPGAVSLLAKPHAEKLPGDGQV